VGHCHSVCVCRLLVASMLPGDLRKILDYLTLLVAQLSGGSLVANHRTWDGGYSSCQVGTATATTAQQLMGQAEAAARGVEAAVRHEAGLPAAAGRGRPSATEQRQVTVQLALTALQALPPNPPTRLGPGAPLHSLPWKHCGAEGDLAALLRRLRPTSAHTAFDVATARLFPTGVCGMGRCTMGSRCWLCRVGTPVEGAFVADLLTGPLFVQAFQRHPIPVSVLQTSSWW
jgi:hypothetical protein